MPNEIDRKAIEEAKVFRKNLNQKATVDRPQKAKFAEPVATQKPAVLGCWMTEEEMKQDAFIGAKDLQR